VVSSLSMHPLVRMMESGLYVTLNTDDPSISQITLSDEYRLAVDHLGMTQARLAERLVAAAQVTFLPANARQALLDRIHTRLRQEHLE
jgi:adenosine deaminase